MAPSCYFILFSLFYSILNADASILNKIQNVTEFLGHLHSVKFISGTLSPGLKQPEAEIIPRLVPRLNLRGSTPPLPHTSS
jgi:hypothetical protein